MGNQPSQTNTLKSKPVNQIIDYIATYYILTMDFQSLRRLHEKEYCDKLVVLTSDIVERYFTDMEITYLAQRIKDGVDVNEVKKDKMIFFDKDDLNKLDVQNKTKKKRICGGIAKFYIKIAHIFAAIVTTINPVYVYKDVEGNTSRASLFEKGKIPVNAQRTIYKLNICENRINALKPQPLKKVEPNPNVEPQQQPKVEEDSESIVLNPKICSININEKGETKNLEDEPGIPELKELYYDDNYDYETGKFKGMSKESQQMFLNDLGMFYKIFTGNNDVPPNITGFSDIKLRDYHKSEKCQGESPVYKMSVKGNPKKNELFSKYAENLKNMINDANKNQESLLVILNELFVYTIDPQTNKKQIRINPQLTEEKLQKIVVKTRELIMKLYLKCEVDFANGIKLYEAIVEEKILETAQKQIETLNKLSENL
jgi:hypothetical protein